MTRVRLAGIGAVLLLCTGAHLLGAQPVSGAGDDAIPLPAGGFRFTIGGLWNDYAALLDPIAGTRRRLLSPLASDSAGVDLVPGLLGVQQALRTLTGQGSYRLTLGPLTADGEVRQSIAPMVLEYGITRRLSLRVVMPYAESRDVSQLLLNRAGTGANVGINPAFGSSGAAARASNGALLRQIDSARTLLTAELARCGSATAANCSSLRANTAGAQALLARALEMRTALQAVYGTAARGAAPVVPLTASPAHAAVTATVAALRTDFSGFGIGAIAAGAAPVGATLAMGAAGIDRIGTDSTFGINYATLGNTRRAGIGDIDLSATALLFDSFDADPRARLTPSTFAVRSALTAGWRFGTAGADRTEDAFDVPIGEGVDALLARSTTDIILGRRFWISATVRAVLPRSDAVAVAIPAQPSASPFVPFSIATATRSLGSRVDVEVAPRASIGQFFGVSGALVARRWGGDRLVAREMTVPGGVTLDTPSRSLLSAGLGVSFSSLASYARGRSRIPAEVLYTHLEPLRAGGSAAVPAMVTERLELRIYTGFPRR